MTTIDFNTSIIPSSQKVWIVHPGRNRKFLNSFIERSRIYLDLPALQIDVENIDSFDIVTARNHLRQNINRSLTYLDSIRPRPGTIQSVFMPTATLESFGRPPERFYKSANSILTTTNRFFREMKRGDLVLIPGRGGVHSGMHAGLIADDVKNARLINIGEYREKMLSRSISWIRHDLTRGQFSPEVYNKITKPPAIKPIHTSENKVNVYNQVFENYVYGDIARTLIFGRQYDGKDPTATNGVNEVIKFLVAAQRCIEIGEIDTLQNATSLKDIISKYHTPDLYENYTINFNSAGQLGPILKSKKVAITASAVLAVLVAAATGVHVYNGGLIELTNTAIISGDDPSVYAPNVRELMDSFPKVVVDEMTQKITESNQSLGLETPLEVKP